MSHESVISFPGLGIGEFTVNSVAFTIPLGENGIDIAWYALIITFGMICCLAYVIFQARKIGVTIDDIIDYALFVIPIGVIGARLYYVIFDTKNTYDSIADVFNIRGGGLAIYGGIIAGALTVVAVSIFKRINFFAIGDCAAPGVLLAQGIGRWGNFMNGEAFGYETDLFCKMGLKNNITYATFGTADMYYVHPTFLYESIWNLLGVVLVYLFSKFVGKKYDGQLILLTFGWYGFGRMFIESLRTDSLTDGEGKIRVSLVLGAVIFVICLALLIFFAIKKPKVGYYYKYPLAAGEKMPKISFAEQLKAAFYTVRTEENAKPVDYKAMIAKAKAEKAEAKKAKQEDKKEENEE